MLKKKTKKKCGNWLCSKTEECQDEITDRHHLFPQTQQARRQYGSLLDESFNLINISNRCHLNKAIPSYDEAEFIEAGEKAGYRLRHLAGKTIRFKLQQEQMQKEPDEIS